MAAAQQFCVKWNSYSTNLQSVFPRLLTSEHFVDVTLACEGQMIKCHKVVLSACSTYFERLLVSNPCAHPIIFMKDMKHFEVQALVDFMYRGEVNVSQDELNSLLIAAEALQIRGLCGSDNPSAVNGGRTRGHTPPSPRVVSETESVCQPTKRRRSDSEAKPRIVSVTSNGEEAGPATFRNEGQTSGEESVDRRQQIIKQESLDADDCYGVEPDLNEDELDRLEQQDDSDGPQQESRTGQPGPSGLSQPPSRSGNETPDKTATGFNPPYEITPISRFVPSAPPNEGDSVLRRLLQSTSTRPDLSVKAGPITFVRIKSEPPDESETSPEEDSGSEAAYKKAVIAEPQVTNRTPYTTPQLRRALEDVRAGASIYGAARGNGVPAKSLRNWMARLDIKSRYALPVQLKSFFHRQKMEKAKKRGKQKKK